MKMKLICDILLVSLSIVLVQSQQQKFVNRHQFGAGKELADFECPEDFGYYPHETDCTQYYVCVFGGALQESCLGGLVYSRELQTCDWPRNAGCNTTSSAPAEKKKESGPSFSTIRITDSRTERPSTKPLTLPTTQATRPRPFEQTDNQFGQDDFESGFTLRPDDRDNRRGLGRKIDAVPNIQQIEERFETTTREDFGRDKQRFETPRPLNPQIELSLRPNSPFAARPQPPTFAPPPQRDVFEPRPQEPEFQRRPQEAQFQPRPFEEPQFQPRPTEPPRTTTTPRPVTTQKTQKTTTPSESDEDLEYDYEYVYDEFGNPVFEEESAEVVQQPTTRTTPRTTTTTERTTTTTAPPRLERITTTATTAPPRLERITTTTTTEAPTEPPSTKKSRVKGGGRGSMKFSETSAASAGTRITPEEQSQKSSKSSGKSKKGRPTLKPVGDLVPSKIEPIDVNKFPPWRFAPVFETPEPDTPAEKCRSDVCQLPDCYCGGKDIPAGLAVEDTPQIVLLTFDDAVNDLNKELYTDIFKKGRTNPNGCPLQATFYISHEWTDYSQVQGLYYDGHEIASHTVSHSFGEQFSTKKWAKETAGQRDIMAAYAGVKAEDIRGMRAPFLSVGGNKMFKMLYDLNFTYDSSMPVYENRPPSYPYTLDYKVFHDCMIPPCPTKSYPGVWEVPMVMWQDLNGGRCSMGDGCSNPPDAEGVYKMLIKNFERHYTTNRAPFPLYYHAAWFTTPHHKEGFLTFMDTLDAMDDVWVITNWQLIQWMREPTSLSKIKDFEPFKCSYPDRPKPCNNPKVCNLWHKAGVRYMKTCQPCPEVYPWTGKTGVKNAILDRYLADES